MKIAVSQLSSVDSVVKNLELIDPLIEEAAHQKTEILFFPENTLYFRIQQNQTLETVELESEFIDKLKNKCADFKIAIHLTTALKLNEKVYNGSVFIDSMGVAKITYLKIHLFDIELVGQKPIRESDVFSQGAGPSIFEYNGFKFGSSICYDIRFAELYNYYARQEVDVLLVPAAFLVRTGQAHWEPLLRARAIESQCYVLASAQAGQHKSVIEAGALRETYGYSMVINPWGEIVAQIPQGVGLIYYDLLKSEIMTVRQQIPMKSHRRGLF